MSDRSLYISRKSAQRFLNDFGRALKKPESNPLVFHIYGIGGMGKSTLLDKLRDTYKEDAKFARAFFGPTSRVDSPLALMEHLHKQLPKDDGWEDDAFTELFKRYKDTLNQLETEPVQGRGSASPEQVGLVKKLLSGTVKAIAGLQMPDKAAEQVGNLAGGVVDVASLALSEKDRLEQLLKQHRATKNKRELQELMLDPLPKLVQAFATSVIQKSRIQPISLILDTYEKASSEFDTFLCKYLISDTALQSYPVRIVMAGRYSLKNKRYQRVFQYHYQLFSEYELEKFDKKETREYLKKIGMEEPKDIRRATQATKGLPYSLNLIKKQKDDGKTIAFSRNSDEIVERLLDGLTYQERKIVELAAYCRWFDRSIIQYLIQQVLSNKEQFEEVTTDWFEWLRSRDFVTQEDHYRIDDVARDVIRLAQHRADEKNFRCIHNLLSQYFEQLASHEVPEELPVPEKYENSDWREHIAEMVYHSLFANRDRGQDLILTYFFEGAHLKQPDIAINSFTAVSAEAEPQDNELLPKDTRRFLDSIQYAVIFGWQILNEHPDKYEFNLETSELLKTKITKSIKSQIESALEGCFRRLNNLDGLAKYSALLARALRCQENQRLRLFQQAQREVEKIVTLDAPEFSNNLYFNLGLAFQSLELYEDALFNYDKAIELKSDAYQDWNNRGNILCNLDRYEDALKNYKRSIELNSHTPKPYHNRGRLLRDLERHEEALVDYAKALDLDSSDALSWHGMGVALEDLERYDEALANYAEALDLNPSESIFWSSRGYLLRNLRRYEEALSDFDQCLQLKDFSVLHARGLCLSFLKRYDEAIDDFQQAIRHDPNERTLSMANQGIVLARAGNYKEALALCDKAIDLKEDEVGYYGKACCYALQGDNAMALELLHKAFEFNPERCQKEARYNPDFDNLRGDKKFQSLLRLNSSE